tara:strand:- start:30214 stop:30549 length:336 start_codon:yes stop_codon:yes gene_type:complete
MKDEINNENKAKFFAQYWGQMVGEGLNGTEDVHRANSAFTEFLNLKPLSSISDEDAITVGYKSASHVPKIKMWSQPNCDYLRLKSYALPWMGLSVEELIEAGWIRLLDKTN